MTQADEQADPHVCEHCDNSVPHTHVDEKPLVDRYRRALAGSTAATAVLVAAWLALSLILASDAALGYVLGMAAWALSTAVGVLIFARAPRQGARAVLSGALGTAAVSPVLALGAALGTDGSVIARALTAGVGWLLLSAAFTGVRAVRLRGQLAADTRDGEAARSAVVRTDGRPTPYTEAGWLLLTAVVFTLCVAATAALPIVVVVLVPLNVVVAVLTRRWRAGSA